MYTVFAILHIISMHIIQLCTHISYYIVKIFINHYQPLLMMNEMCQFQALLILCALAGVSLALHYLHQRGFMAVVPLGKAVFFSHGFMPFFIWLHQQTIIHYSDGDEVEIAGNYCPSHLNRPKQSFYDLCDPVMLLATLRLLLRLLLMLLLQSMSLLLLPLLLLLLL